MGGGARDVLFTSRGDAHLFFCLVLCEPHFRSTLRIVRPIVSDEGDQMIASELTLPPIDNKNSSSI